MSDKVLLQEMGKRIFMRRKSLGLTQEQVAERMNVSMQMISNLELGNKAIRPENLKRLCEVLRVSADYLLGIAKAEGAYGRLWETLPNVPEDKLPLIEQILELCLVK